MNDFFKNRAALTEDKLCALLPESDARYKTVADAMRYSLLCGGKRVRPVMLGEFYKLAGGKDDAYLHFAAALEMIHTYSLIHDDLPCMDNDDFRRGKPSCHKQFSESTALLAGDGLLTLAFSVAAETPLNASRVLKAVKYLSDCAGYRGMIGGQVIDLDYENKKADGDVLKELCLLKTGALLKAAAVIGVILAGGSEEQLKAAAEYGENVGVAFQIIDDILDTTADEKLLGKPVNSDAKNGKSTFVSIYGIEKCRQFADKYTENALKSLDVFGADKTDITEMTEYLLKRNH